MLPNILLNMNPSYLGQTFLTELSENEKFSAQWIFVKVKAAYLTIMINEIFNSFYNFQLNCCLTDQKGKNTEQQFYWHTHTQTHSF